MKLAIFGGSGRTGRPLVEQALAAGHSVTALVRDPAKLPISNERLTLIQGDALDPQAVERTIAGADAVLSALGQTKGSPKNMQTVATQNIVAAMQQHAVRRLVSLTGAGVRAPQDKPKLIDHIIRFALQTLSGDVLRDAEAHADVLRSGGLDWVLVRGPQRRATHRQVSRRLGGREHKPAHRPRRRCRLHAQADDRQQLRAPGADGERLRLKAEG